MQQHEGWDFDRIDDFYYMYEGEYLFKLFRLNRFNWLFLVVSIDPITNKKDLVYSKGFKSGYKKIVEAEAFDYAEMFIKDNN